MNDNKKNVICEELIFLDQKLNNKEDILEFIVKKASDNNYVTDQDLLLKAVKIREEEVSTAIGYLIAIPHGKTNSVKHPFISFVRTTEIVKWDKDNNEMVQLVFLIGVPENSATKLHLKFISELSKKLLDEDFREELLSKRNKKEIFEQLSSINT